MRERSCRHRQSLKISILDIKPIGKITMVQKLLVMERDTKEELQEAIKKHLKDAEFRMVSLSVLQQQAREGLHHANVSSNYFEAWILVEDHALGAFE